MKQVYDKVKMNSLTFQILILPRAVGVGDDTATTKCQVHCSGAAAADDAVAASVAKVPFGRVGTLHMSYTWNVKYNGEH